MKVTEKITITNEDNMELMKRLKNESIDIICIDPPYLYLKKQKLERPFNERIFFEECKRLLTKDGFIVMFGRGTSFYRWNAVLDDIGFTFKEEIVWNKSHCTSPLMNLSRVHETISIFTKGKGTINKVKVPYLEMKSHDLNSVIGDIKRIKSILKNTTSLDAVIGFLENNNIGFEGNHTATNKFNLTIGKFNQEDRCVTVLKSISRGLNEKSIIKQVRDHYSAIHPTQKPVRLLERLLSLVLPKDKESKDIVVADFFGGSFSTMEAVFNMGAQGISCEIDEEYFNKGIQRINNHIEQLKMF